MFGESSGRRVVVPVRGGTPPRSARRASRLPAPVPLRGEPASQLRCSLGSQRTGKIPLGGAVGQGFPSSSDPEKLLLRGGWGKVFSGAAVC